MLTREPMLLGKQALLVSYTVRPQLTTDPHSSKVWQNVLKRGLTSSDVLPSTVSSTTVRGYLPQFSGHVAAALSPTTISGTIGSPNRGSPSKDNEINSNGTSTFMKQKIAETCPPATGERLSDTLLSMVGMKAPAWAN